MARHGDGEGYDDNYDMMEGVSEGLTSDGSSAWSATVTRDHSAAHVQLSLG